MKQVETWQLKQISRKTGQQSKDWNFEQSVSIHLGVGWFYNPGNVPPPAKTSLPQIIM